MPPPSFEIFVSPIADIVADGTGAPILHSQRDGSESKPFLDIRDAMIRAQELAAPNTSAIVSIYLLKGTHFVPLEKDSVRYQPTQSSIPDGLALSIL